MQQPADVSADPHRKSWCVLAASQVFAMTVVGCLCTAAQRYLYADGSNFFVRMLQQRRVMDFDPPRRFAHLLMEYPTVFLLQIVDCRNPLVVGSVYGLTLFLGPVAGLLLTWWAARKEPACYWFYPLLSQSIVWLTMSFMPLDIHVAVGLFWCLLYLLLFTRRMSVPVAMLTIALALMSTRAYQAYVFLSWPLMISAGIRGARAWSDRRYFDLATCLICVSLFLLSFAIALDSTLHPVDSLNRSNFAKSILAHLAYPPVWYSMSVLVCAVWLIQNPETRSGRSILRGATFGCGVLVALLPFAGFVAPLMQHLSRVQGIYVPLILGGLAMIQHYRNRSSSCFSEQQHKDCWRLVAWTCVVAISFQLGATYQWNQFRNRLLSELAEHRGVVPYENFDMASVEINRFEHSAEYRAEKLKEAKKSPIQSWNHFQYSQFNYGFGWTLPSLSVALDAMNLGTVTTIICAPPDVVYQPFDPHDPAAIPDLSRYGVTTDLNSKTPSVKP